MMIGMGMPRNSSSNERMTVSWKEGVERMRGGELAS